jgi:uncharacterized protein YeaO (DUF488 family)
MIRTKRVYEPPEASDGYRVLVDGLWPRGLKKENVHLNEWLKEIAPSPELRKWFDHQETRWPGFAERYKKELRAPEKAAQLKRLKGLAKKQTVTLLYGARDERFNNAAVIFDILRKGR